MTSRHSDLIAFWDGVAAALAHALLLMPRVLHAQPLPPMPAAPTPQTVTVTLAWDASPDIVAGYRIYTGTNSRDYHQTHNAGTNLTTTVSNLASGHVWYFTATAMGTNGLESDYSNEVSLNTVPPRPPQNIGIQTMRVLRVELEGAQSAGAGWSNIGTIVLVLDTDKPQGVFRSKLAMEEMESVQW